MMTHSHTCIGHHFMFPRVTEIKAQSAPEAARMVQRPAPRPHPSEDVVVLPHPDTR
jgi:hypothetical protein